jgi:hypothetical protein
MPPISSDSIKQSMVSVSASCGLADLSQPTSFNPSCPSAPPQAPPDLTQTTFLTFVPKGPCHRGDKPRVEKLSCTCGFTRDPLPGFALSEANGVELTPGENRELTGEEELWRYDITNCTGQAKREAIEALWLCQNRNAALDGSSSEVPRPVLSQEEVDLYHEIDLMSTEPKRMAKEEADRILAQQETILQDTYGMRSGFNRGEGRDDKEGTFLSNTKAMDLAFDRD